MLLFQIAVPSKSLASESSGQVSSAEINASVISSLPTSHGQSADIVAGLDLTRPFETRTQWTYVAAILPGTHPNGTDVQPIKGGPLAQCFVSGLTPKCTYAPPEVSSFSIPIRLYSARVVFAAPEQSQPRLLTKTGSSSGGNGSHAIFTELFTYDGGSNQFISVFSNATGSNNNQETRFMESGPLRGDVIVVVPASSAFGYWITAYVFGKGEQYRRVLRYRSATRYGDGNRLAVIDSEMPGILRHFGLWRPGDPLPTPADCTHPVLRHAEEWCQ
jgi:hypothetical protein